jgi:MFS transporter, PAT family, beta-lactamase induction signal transducer AmpG
MRRQLPPWAMGLAVAPMGFYFGFISTAMPILLAAKGVPVGKIAEVSAVGFSPTFWAFLLCPVLDVRFTKRTYALFFAGLAAVCLGVSTLLTSNLVAFTCLLTLGCTAAVIFGNAHGGWMPDVIEDKHYSQVGGTINVANLGAAGAFATLTVVLVRTLPAGVAAGLLGLTVMAPTVLLFFIPVPPVRTKALAQTPLDLGGPPGWLPNWSREFVRLGHRFLLRFYGWLPEWLKVYLRPVLRFLGELYFVCKRPGCLFGLICFVSPTACFALTNLFSGLGADFHASEWWVTAINGPYVAIVCSVGCLAGIWICQRYVRRTVYLASGFGGAAAALALIWMPHTLGFFALGVLTYNFFQGINYTAFTAFEFEIVGTRNPLACTQFALLTAASNLPISYMTAVDGHFYTTHGLPGMLGVDAVSSVVVGTALLTVFRRIGSRRTEIPVRVGG